MPPFLLRLAYVSEFLLAILSVLTLWSQVGGQDHLDLMPWYTKLVLTLAMALSIVMATASAVAHEHAWNAKTITSLLFALLVGLAMAGVTYYYHLHEDDVDAGGDGVAHFLPATRPEFASGRTPAQRSFRPLFRNSRKTECGAKEFVTRLVVRAAPFAL